MTGVRTSAGKVAQIGRQLPAGCGAADEDEVEAEADEGRRSASASSRVCESFGCGGRGQVGCQHGALQAWPCSADEATDR